MANREHTKITRHYTVQHCGREEKAPSSIQHWRCFCQCFALHKRENVSVETDSFVESRSVNIRTRWWMVVWKAVRSEPSVTSFFYFLPLFKAPSIGGGGEGKVCFASIVVRSFLSSRSLAKVFDAIGSAPFSLNPISISCSRGLFQWRFRAISGINTEETAN